jgi:Secretion system C-terminal sorting domain
MIHDDMPVNVTNSVMLPFVPNNPTTMSATNKNCYASNTNLTCSTPIDNAFEDTQIITSPNPVETALQIRIKDNSTPIELQVFNTLGHLVFSKKTQGEYQTIDFTKYPMGLYFLSLKTNQKTIVRKIIKR